MLCFLQKQDLCKCSVYTSLIDWKQSMVFTLTFTFITFFVKILTLGSAYWSNTQQISDAGDVTCLSILGFSRLLWFWGFISTTFWGEIVALALLMKGRCGFSSVNCSNSLACKMASHLPCPLASITSLGNWKVPSEISFCLKWGPGSQKGSLITSVFSPSNLLFPTGIEEFSLKITWDSINMRVAHKKSCVA